MGLFRADETSALCMFLSARSGCSLSLCFSISKGLAVALPSLSTYILFEVSLLAFLSRTTTFALGVPICRPKLSKFSIVADDDDLDAKRKHYDVWLLRCIAYHTRQHLMGLSSIGKYQYVWCRWQHNVPVMVSGHFFVVWHRATKGRLFSVIGQLLSHKASATRSGFPSVFTTMTNTRWSSSRSWQNSLFEDPIFLLSNH